MADIPSENTCQSSTLSMPGAADLMENGQNLPYISNCHTDRDDVQTPKMEYLKTWDTPDFYEFERVFKCPRNEFIYLIKGICWEKSFNVTIGIDNNTRSYRLLTFRCSDLVSKKKNKTDRSLVNERCEFYLQYVEEPDRADIFRLHSYERRHKHALDAEIVVDLSEYFQRTTHKRYNYKSGSAHLKEKKDWKGEFMKSLTYELTTIYADQMAEQKQQGLQTMIHPQLPKSSRPSKPDLTPKLYGNKNLYEKLYQNIQLDEEF